MPGGIAEVFRDVDPLVQGTQKCRTWLAKTISDPGSDFKSCGVRIGLYVANLTDGSHGFVEDVTEDNITVTLTGGISAVWAKNDIYQVFKTSDYGSIIEHHYVDRRFGHKVLNPNELVDGIKPDEIDVDEYERNIFSPDQPTTNKKGW